MKYIVVTGGVVSGLGKGITISSIGRILKSSGLRVTAIKIDPYLNVDAGTMSPFEHGETFVLNDGGETDLDLGNYERFLDITLSGKHNITTGKVYRDAIHQERRGDYLGKTVQIVPHVTDIVQGWIQEVARISVDSTGLEPEVCLIEVGGTVGDIESMVFLEALRQFQFKVGRENIMFTHVSLVPVLGSVGEQKTKPTQHTVKELRSLGLNPDVIVCRSSELLSASTKAKLSVFCHVDTGSVISVHDVSNIYHVPLMLVEQGMHTIIRTKLGLSTMTDDPDLDSWSAMATSVDTVTDTVEIAIVGKYTDLQDAYLSVIKSLKHSGIHLNLDVVLRWIEASDLEEGVSHTDPPKYEAAWATLRRVSGVVVPGGFGARGVEGKIAAAKFAREEKKPYLGVCLGFQVMVIEYVRNVLHKVGAHSTEFDESTPHPAIIFMPEINQQVMGGTMRLGARPTSIVRHLPSQDSSSSLASEIYGLNHAPGDSVEVGAVMERHRHRYEVNPELVEDIEKGGLFFTGKDESGVRMEIAELPRSQHPYYVGTQYHPEFKSRPNRPSPPFCALVAVAAGRPEHLGLAGALWQEHEGYTEVHSKSRSGSLQEASLGLLSPSRKRSASALSSNSGQGSPSGSGPVKIGGIGTELVAGKCTVIGAWPVDPSSTKSPINSP